MWLHPGIFDRCGRQSSDRRDLVEPASWHPIADQVPPDKLRNFLDTIEKAYGVDAGRMPDHAAYLSRFAPMPKENIPA